MHDAHLNLISVWDTEIVGPRRCGRGSPGREVHPDLHCQLLPHFLKTQRGTEGWQENQRGHFKNQKNRRPERAIRVGLKGIEIYVKDDKCSHGRHIC